MKGDVHNLYQSISPSTMLSPTPVVLVSCADRDHPNHRNIITVAWTGTINSDPPMLSISLRKDRYSYNLIVSSGEFVVNLVDASLCKAADYCGVRSGRDVDKAEDTGLKYTSAYGLETAPAIEGTPVRISCKVRKHIELGSHDLFIAEIVAVQIREDLIDRKGAIHLEQANLVAYSHGLYQQLGRIIGFFGYSVARKEVLENRMAALRKQK